MPTFVHLTAADVTSRRWKNGRGTTDELLLVPRDGDFGALRFDWRVARAGVDESGPFSEFPGFDRVIVVVAGAGLEMEHGPAAPSAFVPPLEPYEFAGEWSTSAALTDGPVRDVNVLLRRSAVQAEVAVVRSARWERSLHGSEAFVHALGGVLTMRVGGEPALVLAPGESLFARDLVRPTLCAMVAADGADPCALLVDVTRRAHR